MAQTATGITLKLSDRGPMFSYQSGVYAIRKRIPDIRPRMVSCDVVNLLLFMFFLLVIVPSMGIQYGAELRAYEVFIYPLPGERVTVPPFLSE